MGDYIRVRATQKGFFLQYREIGDEFVITEERMFSHNWMERLSPPPVVVAKPEVKIPVAQTESVPTPVAVVPAQEAPKQKRKYVKKQKTGAEA